MHCCESLVPDAVSVRSLHSILRSAMTPKPWTPWREIKRSQQFNFQESASSLSWSESRARPRWHELNSLNRLILPYFENRFQAKRLIIKRLIAFN